MADPVFDDLEDAVAERLEGVAVRRAGWRCSGTEERPCPGFRRSSGGFRRRSVLLGDEGTKAQKGFSVLFYVFWAFL
jgi:hypothetical protein